MQWFDLLIKLREATGVGVPPEKIVAQIRCMDPAMLEGAHIWLLKFVGERFELEFDKLNRVKALIPRRANAAKKRRARGQATEDFVRARLRYYRSQRVPEDDIPPRIAKDRGLSIGRVQNHIRNLRKSGRLGATHLAR